MSENEMQQSQEPLVVDFDLLEAAKENVQPLATGRRVTALSALLATPHAQRDAKLAATRNRLRINVELALEDEDGDPLEAYCRLVYWTLENYPQGHSAESGLLELLEEATRVLKDHNDGVCRGDLKYLKLWLLYASYVERPTIIYQFLLANDIGANFALLYEEHAAVLERDGRKQEADEVYRLGIARKADPLDHLGSRYQEFQKRMMTRVSATPAAPAPTSQPSRKALAVTKSATAKFGSASSQSTVAATLPSVPSSSRAGFQIFSDTSGRGGEVIEPSKGQWQDIGTRKTRVKENVPETQKLVGATIKQAGRSSRIASASGTSSSGSSNSKIVPFRDPVEAPPSARPKAKPAASKGFVPFVDGKKEASPAPTPTPATSTPKFTPFRDEAEDDSSRATPLLTDSIIKIKQTSVKAPVPASEAEALRKDPLKNYDIGEIRG
ncbi:hypothetical protein FA15DRAFT_615434 [Coprinopsis marcescibilis]|uniref:BUB1 N-terminal domain-containing protein n=1 Tax=Coprinopsis marcescibilis TaxID=230819 RepID=A0A5C3L0V0_COPMA|nr:hypothetical protein FA15DRAFT_615434 [Coprinopsis marcescibilis]